MSWQALKTKHPGRRNPVGVWGRERSRPMLCCGQPGLLSADAELARQLPVSGTVPVPSLLLQALNTAAAPALRLVENTLLEQ
jgi:hypothetical protein